MKKRILSFIIGLFLLTVISTANAAATTYVTITETGLDWATFDQTIGMSYLEVCAEFGLDNSGYSNNWRYAELDEVMSLYSSITNWGGYGWNATNPPTVEINNNSAYWGMTDGIGALLGYTHFNETGLRAVEVISRPGLHDYPLTLNRVSYYTPNGNPAGEERISHDSGWQPGYDLLDYGWAGSRNIASYLVRDASAIPVPGAIWLLGSGLLGLVGYNRKIKK